MPRLTASPMVVIAGDIPTHYYGKHPHQEVNLHADAAQWEIYRPFVKRAWRVDRAPSSWRKSSKGAFHMAESGQPGPVLVNVPMDIFSQRIPADSFERVAQNTRALKKPALDDDTRAGDRRGAAGRGEGTGGLCPAAASCSRGPAKSCAGSWSIWAFRSPHSLMGKARASGRPSADDGYVGFLGQRASSTGHA